MAIIDDDLLLLLCSAPPRLGLWLFNQKVLRKFRTPSAILLLSNPIYSRCALAQRKSPLLLLPLLAVRYLQKYEILLSMRQHKSLSKRVHLGRSSSERQKLAGDCRVVVYMAHNCSGHSHSHLLEWKRSAEMRRERDNLSWWIMRWIRYFMVLFPRSSSSSST